MKFLLLNTNQIVQKLVEITAKKAGADLTTISESSQLTDVEQYAYIIVDDDCFALDSQTYTEAFKNKRKCLIYNKQGTRIEGFDEYIQKPFLPTSILDVFTSQLKREASAQHIESMTADSDDMAHMDFAATLDEADLESEASSAPLNLNELDEGLKEIDTLLDDSLADIESVDNSVDDMEAAQSDVITSDEAMPSAEEPQTPQDEAQDKEISEGLDEKTSDEALELESSTAEAVEAVDKIQNDSNEVALDDELDIDIDLSSLDELKGFDDEKEHEPTQQDEAKETQESDEEGLEPKSTDSTDNAESTLESDDIEQLASLTQSDEPTHEDTPLQDNHEILSDETLDNEADDKAEPKQSVETNSIEADTQSQAHVAHDEQSPNIQEAQPDDEKSPQEGYDELEDFNLEELDLDDLQIDIQDDESQAQESSKTEESIEDRGQIESLDSSALESQLESTLESELDSKEPQAPIEFSTEGLLENDLLNDVEGIAFDEPVLDKEQISEVSQALQAIDDDTPQDFASLQESEVAQALGEEIPQELYPASQESTESSLSPAPNTQALAHIQEPTQESHANSEDIIKNMIASSVQGSIASLSASNLKSMLDGLEVTINISFKDKSK